MAPLDFLSTFRDREGEDNVLKAKWYIAAATGLTAAGAGELVLELYRLVSAELPLENKRIVQRRIKEAILKGSILYGVPRMGQALSPLNNGIPEEEIDNYGPRTESLSKDKENEILATRGHIYFDKLWNPSSAQAMRDRLTKYQQDQQLMVQKIYEDWISEDRILSDVETQMCNATLLTCWNSPTHALWHTRGVVRLGGTVEQARFAQDLGIAIATEFNSKTGDIIMVDNIDF